MIVGDWWTHLFNYSVWSVAGCRQIRHTTMLFVHIAIIIGMVYIRFKNNLPIQPSQDSYSLSVKTGWYAGMDDGVHVQPAAAVYGADFETSDLAKQQGVNSAALRTSLLYALNRHFSLWHCSASNEVWYQNVFQNRML